MDRGYRVGRLAQWARMPMRRPVSRLPDEYDQALRAKRRYIHHRTAKLVCASGDPIRLLVQREFEDMMCWVASSIGTNLLP